MLCIMCLNRWSVMQRYLQNKIFWLVGCSVVGAWMCLLPVSVAQAHPHVSIIVKSVVMADDAGKITAIRHAWTFDEAFSAYSIVGLDTDKDGKLSREELAPLAQVNVESLHEYAFFTILKRDKEKAAFGEARDYALSYDGTALTLHFTLPVTSHPFAAQEVKLEVYDSSFFVAFNFADGIPVQVEGAGGKCTATFTKPKASITQRLSQMSESFFETMKPGTMDDASTPVRFTCK